MPTQYKSRRTDYSKVHRLLEDVPEEEVDEVEPEIEEKISQVRPFLTDEEKLVGMNTLKPKKPEHGSGPPIAKTSKMALPQYIERMEEGEQKQKTIKAAAQAALILGQSPHQVALQYGIASQVVYQWQQTILTMTSAARRDRLGGMLMIFIEQELKSLMAISIVTSREDWILRQNADDLAHFVAAKTDRILMLLTAFGRVAAAGKQYADQLEVIAQDGKTT